MNESKPRRCCLPHSMWKYRFAVLIMALAVGVTLLYSYYERGKLLEEVSREAKSLGGVALWEYDGPDYNGPFAETFHSYLADAPFHMFWKIHEVNLNLLPASDYTMNQLSKLTALESLEMSNPQFSPESWKILSRMITLKHLSLTGIQIADEQVKHIGELKNLEELYLDGTKVSDDGLRHLEDLNHLKLLELTGTGVTKKGVEKLEKTLPRCVIYYDDYKF